VKYRIDTNIISEVRKGTRCDPRVTAWYASVEDADIYLSVLVLGEILKGIERVRAKDPTQASALESGWPSRQLFYRRDGIACALYITAIGRRVVVVRAFAKKTQKTPRIEIELALRRAKEIT
jgi:phage-related protein